MIESSLKILTKGRGEYIGIVLRHKGDCMERPKVMALLI
jgi:hypothetical protein